MRTIRATRRVEEWALRLTVTLFVTLCTACGGGGDGGFISPPAPLTCDQKPNGAGCPTTGNIQVTVNGVPSDVPAPQIELYPEAGSGFYQPVIDGSGTFPNLEPGPYAVVAQPTSNSPTVRHSAHPDQFSVTVVPGKTTQLTFAFSPRTLGAIEFTVQGLPSGRSGSLTIQGPNSSGTHQLHEGVNTVPHLDAGAWMITLPNVFGFAPQPRTIQAIVTTGSITPAPSVTYVPTGILALEVAGLPAGVMAEGTITGPDGFSAPLKTFVWARVVVGTYTATPTTVRSGGVTYTASAQSALVARAAVARLTVTYAAATTGNIQVTVNGVPSDVPTPRIELYLADGSELSFWGAVAVIDGSGTFADLEPGPYTVVALPTWNSPTVLHSPRAGQFNVTVVPGKTAQATFAFSPQTLGAIEFTVQGLPSASSGLIVQGPNGSRTQLVRDGVNTVPHLDAGGWMITLPNVSGFVPQARTIQATVTTGSITPAPSVTYEATGILALEVAGLPSGVTAEGTLTGPNGFSTPLKTFVWARVVVGTYTATPTNVSSGGVTYTASVQTAAVTRAAAARLTLTYTIAAGSSIAQAR